MTTEELKSRTKTFALRVMKMVEADELTAIMFSACRTTRARLGWQCSLIPNLQSSLFNLD